MSKKDYYQILEVERTASAADIKKAYRQMALKYHPDRNPGDKEAEENFKLAGTAYEILSDQEKRQIYDQFGEDGLKGRGYGFSSAEDIFSSFGEIFEDFFGGGFASRGQGGQRIRRGADLRYDLEIDFFEAVEGTKKNLEIPKHVSCNDCKGQGFEPGHKPQTCQHCGGSGQMRISQGFFSIASTCSVCRGQGAVVTHPCKSCKGQGFVKSKRSLKVDIPRGVATGNRLRLEGEGDPGLQGGPPGDLYVIIHVREHETFKRDGDHIHSEIFISFPQAALGTEIEIDTLEGKETLKVSAGLEHGEEIVLKAKGIKNVHGGKRGDHIIHVGIASPKKLSKREEELYRELAELTKDKVLHKKKGFFS